MNIENFDDFFGTPIIFDNAGKIDHVIGIASISGGANYKNDMPLELSLLKRNSDGKETRANYIQKDN